MIEGTYWSKYLIDGQGTNGGIDGLKDVLKV